MIKIRERSSVNIEMTQDQLAALETLLDNCRLSNDGEGIPLEIFHQLKAVVKANKLFNISMTEQEILYLYSLLQASNDSWLKERFENMDCRFNQNQVLDSLYKIIDDIADTQELWNVIHNRGNEE